MTLSKTIKTYFELLTNRLFIIPSLITLVSYGGLFSTIITVPVYLIHMLKMDPVNFGTIIFVTNVAAYGFGGFTNARLLGRFTQITDLNEKLNMDMERE